MIDYDRPSNLPRLRELLTELYDLETHLERFFQLSPDLQCIANTTGTFIKLNLAWTDVLGWTREELMADTFFKFIHPDDVEKTMHILGKMTLKSITGFKNRYRCRSGEYVTLDWSATCWSDGYTYASARPCPIAKADSTLAN